MNTTCDMGRKKTNRERVQITLPSGMADALADAAAAKGWDRSRLLEELARTFLEQQKPAKPKPPKGKP